MPEVEPWIHRNKKTVAKTFAWAHMLSVRGILSAESRCTQRMAWARLVLGVLQILGGIATILPLVATGPGADAVLAGVVTGGLTLSSILLFGGPKARREEMSRMKDPLPWRAARAKGKADAK